jgi:hypothetical protein
MGKQQGAGARSLAGRQGAADHKALYLVGALEDLSDLGAHVPLDSVVAGAVAQLLRANYGI